MFYRFHDLKRLQREQSRSSSSITLSSSSSSLSHHCPSESSKPQNGKSDDDKNSNSEETVPQKKNSTPIKQSQNADRFANLCEQMGTELDEVTQNCLEYSLPVTLPALSWLLGYSRAGVWFCIATVIFHTLESALTNFGPQTVGFRCNFAPVSPVKHMIIDCVIILSHSISYVLFPNHFGKHPYVLSFCIICTLPYYVASSYKTHLHKTRREQMKKPRTTCTHTSERCHDTVVASKKVTAGTARSNNCTPDSHAPLSSGPINHLLQRRRHPPKTSLQRRESSSMLYK